MAKDSNIVVRTFDVLNLQDSFFDSLRKAYRGFDDWFRRKGKEHAYVMSDAEGIQAFLYLKVEYGPITDITPPLNTDICLKVGTFKINAHGTKLGERFVKKIFDHAIVNNIKHIYVTVFDEHWPLISILEKYGFVRHGTKTTPSGTEQVYLKDFNRMTGSIVADYPVLDAVNCNKWLLAIYPQWHTKLFPDSILRTENSSIIDDISHTNSIHKVYISWARDIGSIKNKDLIIIYRTKDSGPAWYRSVATSICAVENIKAVNSFTTLDDFKKFTSPHSVFTDEELTKFYKKQVGYAIKMTYNIALPKRPNMASLVENVGLNRDNYWGFMKVDDKQFLALVEESKVPKCGVILP
ncbi:hypothetical protein [Pseudodesulfovibrio karagichevae]|uniref:N-acetyltransferase domain-containing protein n=1 Tax=Pseudodesulfovibrio karagichevae TaxID=3239305 RepID=A0ABV4K3J1_9BACT